MSDRQTYRQHLRAILALGLPLIGSHLAQIAITLTDTAMLGWYSVEALAAGVLGGEYFFILFIMGSGFAWAVMPMVASAASRGDEVRLRRVTRMGLWVSTLFGLVAVPLLLFTGPVLNLLGQNDEVAALAHDYNLINGWAIIPALLVMVLKSYLAALERAQVVLWVTIGAAVLNAVANYLLIFGNFGAPELGIRGAAVASFTVNMASLVVLVVYVRRALPEHELFVRFWRLDSEIFRQVFRLGWPIGLTGLFETSLFVASSIMMGWLGTVELAAHGAALMVTSVFFMVHVGFGNAATVRAGQAFGREDRQGLRDGALMVIAASMTAVAVTIVIFLSIPEFLIGLFLHPEELGRAQVIAIGASLLAAAALFQLVDAAQAMALGLLRGVQDTAVPMVIAAFAYWVVGVPMSYVLGFWMGYGGVGIWLGLVIGLALAGACLMTRFWGWSLRALP